MKKIVLSLLLAVFLSFSSFAQIAQNWEVGTWFQFKTAAVSYTMDDGTSNQLPVALPLFNSYGYKVTMFTVTDWSPNWSALQTQSNNGHEIASHTVSHLNFSGASVSSQDTECKNSQNAINSNITNTKCVTIAYPNCNMGDLNTISKYYIAGRTCSGQIISNSPNDFYTLSSIICGSTGVNTTQGLNDKVAQARSSKGWCVFLFHGFDNDGGYSPISSSVVDGHLSYIQSNDSDYWVGTFGNVAKYIKERNAAAISETSISNDSLSISLSDNLDNSIYNAAITLRRVLPNGWTNARVWQSSKQLESKIVSVNGNTYVMFNAVPDAGTIYVANPDASSTPAPIVTSPVFYRLNSTAQPLSASGTNLKWYTSVSGGTASTTAPTPATTSVGVTTYYVTQTVDNIESARTGIAVHVYEPQGPFGGTAHVIPGTIQLEDFDTGGADTAYFDSTPGTEVDPDPGYRAGEDVDIETCTDIGGGYNLGWTAGGEWLEYTVNVTATGIYDLTLRVACEGDGRTVSITDENGTDIAADIAIPNTTGWQVWEDVIVNDIPLTQGEHIFRLTIGATDFVNLNYMSFDTDATNPVVAITNPADGSTFNTSQTVSITADATSPNSTINNVKFYAGTTLLYTDNSAPYSYDWSGMEAGTYEITAEATDANNATASDKVTVTIDAAPDIIHLNAGWNLIGYPFHGSQALETALSGVWSNIEVVKDMDAFYLSNQDPILNSLKTLEWGKGYCIKVSNACDLIWNE